MATASRADDGVPVSQSRRRQRVLIVVLRREIAGVICQTVTTSCFWSTKARSSGRIQPDRATSTTTYGCFPTAMCIHSVHPQFRNVRYTAQRTYLVPFLTMARSSNTIRTRCP